MTSITDRITAAAAEYQQARAAWDVQTFDFGANESPAPAPAESVEARAGQILAERGLVGALAYAVRLGLDGGFDGPVGDQHRQVATLLMLAAGEASDA